MTLILHTLTAAFTLYVTLFYDSYILTHVSANPNTNRKDGDYTYSDHQTKYILNQGLGCSTLQREQMAPPTTASGNPKATSATEQGYYYDPINADCAACPLYAVASAGSYAQKELYPISTGVEDHFLKHPNHIPCVCDSNRGFASSTIAVPSSSGSVGLHCVYCGINQTVPSIVLDPQSRSQGCAKCGGIDAIAAELATTNGNPSETLKGMNAIIVNSVYDPKYPAACRCPQNKDKVRKRYVLSERIGDRQFNVQFCVECPSGHRISDRDPSLCERCVFPYEVDPSDPTKCHCTKGYELLPDGRCGLSSVIISLLRVIKSSSPGSSSTITPQNIDNTGLPATTPEVPSAIVGRYFMSAAISCTDGNYTACNLLANLCVLSSYIVTSAPCAIYLSLLHNEEKCSGGYPCEIPATIPWLYYNRPTANVLNDRNFRRKVALDETIPFVLSRYAWDGTWLGTESLVTQLQTCDLTAADSLGFYAVGSYRNFSCHINIAQYVVAQETQFFELFIRDNSGKLFPVPVKTEYSSEIFSPDSIHHSGLHDGDEVKRANTNNLKRRFYIYDNIGGRHETVTSNRGPIPSKDSKQMESPLMGNILYTEQQPRNEEAKVNYPFSKSDRELLSSLSSDAVPPGSRRESAEGPSDHDVRQGVRDYITGTRTLASASRHSPGADHRLIGMTKPSYITFAKHIHLLIEVRPDHSSTIYVPLLVIQYASKFTAPMFHTPTTETSPYGPFKDIFTTKTQHFVKVVSNILSNRYGSVSVHSGGDGGKGVESRRDEVDAYATFPVSTSTIFTKDQKDREYALMVTMIVLCVVCLCSATWRTYGWMRRQQNLLLGCDVSVRFFIYLVNHISNTFFIVVVITSGMIYILFKNQKNVEYMLPTHSPYLFGMLYSAAAGKGVHIIHKVFEQCNADIFVIDWERSKGHLLRESKEVPISMWRSTFIANELNELQILRGWRPLYTMMVIMFFLEGLDYMCLATAVPQVVTIDIRTSPTNNVLRIAVGAFFWIVIGVSLYIIEHYIYYKQFKVHPLKSFCDLCSVSNISIVILIEPKWGFYIHGQSIHAYSDVSIEEFQTNLKVEAQGNMPARGLGGLSDCQTFEVFIGEYLRSYLDLCYAELAMEYRKALNGEVGAVEAYQHRKCFDFIRGGVGKTRTFTDNTLTIKRHINDAFIASVRESEKNILNKDPIHALLDYPPSILQQNGPNNTYNFFFTDKFDHWGRFTLQGIDMDVFIWYMMLFFCIDTTLHNPFVSIIICYVVDLLLVFYRSHEGEANIGSKTLFDERFFL